MCNLYRMKAPRAEVAATFGAIDDPELPLTQEELYPRRDAIVVRRNGALRLDVMRWGFPPPAAAKAPAITNVRNLASPFWRTALAKPERRCLVPVTSFCEWEGEAGAKRKCWFALPSRPVFAFAGVWRPTESGPTFAFLTCEPNSLVAPIHPKAMPVILQEEDYGVWLNGSYDEAKALAEPFPAQLMYCERE